MKAEITRSELFDIKISGLTHKGFTKVDTWSGMAKYRNKDGEVIATDSFIEGMFSWMMAPHKGKVNSDEITIIMASPCFQELHSGIIASGGQSGVDGAS